MFRLIFRRKSKTTADDQYEPNGPSCNDEKSWQKICNSKWPSTTDPRVRAAISSAHRSFYSDCSLSASYRLPSLNCLSSDTKKLISSVDIYYDDQVIFSKVMETETVSDKFLSSPLKLSLLGERESIPITPLKYDTDDRTSMSIAKQHLRVSWILIDPDSKRAVNIASREAVKHSYLPQYSEPLNLRYATVVATGKRLVALTVRISCDLKGREIIVKDVGMEFMRGSYYTMNGRESMVILQAAMEGSRQRMDTKMEKRNYKKFLDKRISDMY